MHIVPEGFFYRKRIVLKNCVKNRSAYTQKKIISASIKTLNLYSKPSTAAMKHHFKKHLAYQIKHRYETKFPLPLNVLYRPQTIKLAIKTMAEPLNT